MPSPFSVVVRVVIILAICISGYNVVAVLGRDVVRASGPVPVQNEPQGNSSCCLIPANRGLYKD